MIKNYPNIEVLDRQPGDWDVSKTARIWETYLSKYPQIDAAYFHNDDMALAAYNVMKALAAVTDGRMTATVRNPSGRIHGGSIVAGVAAVVAGQKTGEGGIPKHIIMDGPVVTKENAPGLLWMEDNFLL